jgi:hypothetical protein
MGGCSEWRLIPGGMKQEPEIIALAFYDCVVVIAPRLQWYLGVT